MTHRNPFVVLLLTVVTFTLYGYYWLYVTTDELRRETGRELSPVLDVLIAVLTAGLWGLYVSWRNAGIAHEVLTARGVEHVDSQTAVLVFNLSTFVWGAGWLVSLFILQLDYNRLSRHSILPASSAVPMAA